LGCWSFTSFSAAGCGHATGAEGFLNSGGRLAALAAAVTAVWPGAAAAQSPDEQPVSDAELDQLLEGLPDLPDTDPGEELMVPFEGLRHERARYRADAVPPVARGLGGRGGLTSSLWLVAVEVSRSSFVSSPLDNV
jgi:hypothetical protein